MAGGASAFRTVESVVGFGTVNPVAPPPITGVTRLERVDEPPVPIALPGGACRTDAPADADVPDAAEFAGPAPGAEAPSVGEPPTVDVRGGSKAFPVVVGVPGDGEAAPGSVASAAPAGLSEVVDPVSSAHATPGVAATAIPTPNATASPPTRPMYLALLMAVPLAVAS